MKAGRKKGQTQDNPAPTTAYQMRELDRDIWRRVKILALKRNTSIKDLILELLEKELKTEKL